jgi:hypothetical protein
MRPFASAFFAPGAQTRLSSHNRLRPVVGRAAREDGLGGPDGGRGDTFNGTLGSMVEYAALPECPGSAAECRGR